MMPKILLFLTVKEDTSHTIGVEFGSKVVNINNKTVKLQIWLINFLIIFIYL